MDIRDLQVGHKVWCLFPDDVRSPYPATITARKAAPGGCASGVLYQIDEPVPDWEEDDAHPWLDALWFRLAYEDPEQKTDGWRPMETAPKDGTVIALKMPLGIYAAFYSSECGWLYITGTSALTKKWNLRTNAVVKLSGDELFWKPLGE